jgi:hypothetical protein
MSCDDTVFEFAWHNSTVFDFAWHKSSFAICVIRAILESKINFWQLQFAQSILQFAKTILQMANKWQFVCQANCDTV